MFNSFKKKPYFEVYYLKFIDQRIVKNSKHYKPITAAFLFVISDLMTNARYDMQSRTKNAKEIFSILENKYLTESDFEIFDKCVNWFSKIANNEIKPHGFWCLYDGQNNDLFYNLLICYGDLLDNDKYIDNYENAPILIRGITESLDFTREFFNKIGELTHDYLSGL